MNDPRACALYRHFDADGTLLYVGVSVDPLKRAYEHQLASHWWGDIRNITIEPYLDEQSARDAETEAIETEHPKWNAVRPGATRSSLRTELTDSDRDELRRMYSAEHTPTLAHAAAALGVQPEVVEKFTATIARRPRTGRSELAPERRRREAQGHPSAIRGRELAVAVLDQLQGESHDPAALAVAAHELLKPTALRAVRQTAIRLMRYPDGDQGQAPLTTWARVARTLGVSSTEAQPLAGYPTRKRASGAASS